MNFNKNRRVTLFQILGRDRMNKKSSSQHKKSNTTEHVQLPLLYDNFLTEHRIHLGQQKQFKSIKIQDDFPPNQSLSVSARSPIRLQSIFQSGQMNIKIDQLLNRKKYVKSSIHMKLH
ncbi:unnamed protein product (macronuclear) [Paramecium tetraurelia]|uniref:Uncharacterized protein n=1 Tax=Paramecium tetraurelia TaxID=5888 RepID=A0DWB6_PARTE|nr:uncharacterized protein GSPATT00020975001 [Paramecium tetraurelia]CAK87333.1 unnamed protein product [Paramecium tetraurelia]|eukprot:XP_001454730.1 hypothetical protein (macronuclear) [Paramecium tetraurelia strain d4-2]